MGNPTVPALLETLAASRALAASESFVDIEEMQKREAAPYARFPLIEFVAVLLRKSTLLQCFPIFVFACS
jgi:hypothetical protein